MRAVIICGGAVSDYEYIKKQIAQDDVIIAADRGYDHAKKMGLEVAAVVGDFDSIESRADEIPNGVEIQKYPARKNETDTEIAIEYARSRGFKNFLLLAATGSRLDHTLTNIFLLKEFAERGEAAVILNENNKITLATKDLTVCVTEKKGAILSLVPLTECTGVTTKNLEYPLSGQTLCVGKGLGVSNVTTGDCAEVAVESGELLVIVARD